MSTAGRKLRTMLRGVSRHAQAADDTRQMGDAARGTGDWAIAARAYDLYLAENPEDAAIWVQLGHALKEDGRPSEAESAYHRALALTPADADLHLQLGHLMKVMKRTDDAARSYEASMRLSVTLAALRELEALDRKEIAGQLLERGLGSETRERVFLQVNDFLSYLCDHKTVSGIQRVQLGLINYVLRAAKPDVAAEFGFVFTDAAKKLMWLLPRDHIRAVAAYVGGDAVDHPTLRRLINIAMDNARAVRLGRGDTCIVTGAFWGSGDSFDVLRAGNRDGALCGVFFHDVLPISHPEFFDSTLSADFAQNLGDILSLIDFGFSNSDATAREVKRFAAARSYADIDVLTVPLAHSFHEGRKAGPEPDATWPVGIAALQGRQFVLCVGTIEARKNHRYLFDAWKAMVAEGLDVPLLVFVGRRGWRVDDLFAQFKATRFLDGRLRILHDLTDEELTTLYRHCMFTTFPSLVEGWGLPIGESLSHGKVCVASNTSSMVEVGGDFVDYVDPLNLRNGISVFKALVSDPVALAQREAAIRKRFRRRSWDDVGADLVKKVLEAQTRAASRTLPARILAVNSGDLAPASGSVQSRHAGNLVRISVRLGLTGAWHRPDRMHAWLGAGTARIEFASDVGPSVPVVVYLQLNTVPWVRDNTLTVQDGHGRASAIRLEPGRAFPWRIKTSTDAASMISLALQVGGDVQQDNADDRLICVGLTRFAHAAEHDAGSRATILESLVM